MNRLRKISRPIAIGAALVAPMLATVPSHASTSFQGCTLTPERPAYAGFNNASNIPVINYKFTIDCDQGLSAEVKQVRMEQDLVSREGDAPDDQTGTFSKVYDFPNGGVHHVTVQAPLPNTGPSNEGATEEVYQKVKMRVTSTTVTGPWTPFELTDVRSIHR
ncbi:MAG TPA: hypothetical protein VH419_01435 [Nocardioidaceae bacterium]|jgi:hypothetical protein